MGRANSVSGFGRAVYDRAAMPPARTGGGALQYGLRLGLRCGRCCVNLMAILLVIGVMDARTMGVVAGAIAVERLAPHGARVAHAIGVVVVGTGLFLIARGAGLG